jgi:hypothetical protein
MAKRSFNLRKVIAIAICLAGLTMFSGCGKSGGDDNGGGGDDNNGGGKLKTMEEIIPLIPNFRFSSVNSMGQYAYLVICEAGFAYSMSGLENPGHNNWAYCDYDARKEYELYRDETGVKLGFWKNVSAGAVEQAKKDIYLSDHASFIFRHEKFINYDMAVIGKEKIAGRNTTIYRDAEIPSMTNTFWIDDEIGITLKWTTNYGGGAEWEILEIKFGGCHMSHWVNPSDYTLAQIGQ